MKTETENNNTRSWLERRADSYILLLLGLLVFAVFANTLGNEFVSDDHLLIEFNYKLRDINYFSKIFVDSHAYDVPWVNASFKTIDYYRPFRDLVQALAFQAFGLQPFYWHLLNILIFGVIVALCYAVAKQISSNKVVACSATLLFIAHPIHSEVVSWVNCLGELLHGMFFLAGFALYLQSERESKKLYSIGSLMLFVAALLSKEAALCFPILVAAHRFINDERALVKRVLYAARAAAPYLALVAIYLIWRFLAYGGSLRIASRLPVETVIFTAPSVILEYFRMMLVPVGLNYVHSVPLVDSPISLRFLLPAALLIAGAVLVWIKTSRQVAFACAWIIVTMLPILNIGIFTPDLIVQDRYVFLPSVGFCIGVALGFNNLLNRYEMLPRLRHALILLLVLVAISMFGLTIRQNGFWRSDVTLFARAAQLNPDSEYAQCSYGWALYHQGNREEATRYFTLSYRLKDGMSNCGCVGMGNYYADKGDFDQAVQFYERAIELGEGENNLLLFTELAQIYRQKGESSKAIKLLSEIVTKYPDFQEAQHMLVLLTQNK
jgi:protein O-mannosyl-transferase